MEIYFLKSVILLQAEELATESEGQNSEIRDIEDVAGPSSKGLGRPVAHYNKRKRQSLSLIHI